MNVVGVAGRNEPPSSPDASPAPPCTSGVYNRRQLLLLQLQNSKTVIQAKDAVIQELKERVAYLEAEVRLSGAVLGGAGVSRRFAELQPSPKSPRQNPFCPQSRIPTSRVVASIKPSSFFRGKRSLCWRFWCFLPSWVACFGDFCVGMVCEPVGRTERASGVACLVFPQGKAAPRRPWSRSPPCGANRAVSFAESGDARPHRAPDREASEPGRAQRPGALQVGVREQVGGSTRALRSGAGCSAASRPEATPRSGTPFCVVFLFVERRPSCGWVWGDAEPPAATPDALPRFFRPHPVYPAEPNGFSLLQQKADGPQAAASHSSGGNMSSKGWAELKTLPLLPLTGFPRLAAVLRPRRSRRLRRGEPRQPSTQGAGAALAEEGGLRSVRGAGWRFGAGTGSRCPVSPGFALPGLLCGSSFASEGAPSKQRPPFSLQLADMDLGFNKNGKKIITRTKKKEILLKPDSFPQQSPTRDKLGASTSDLQHTSGCSGLGKGSRGRNPASRPFAFPQSVEKLYPLCVVAFKARGCLVCSPYLFQWMIGVFR